jgi:O6-methylguanine-DNA--protein-cysteine methyltransferase
MAKRKKETKPEESASAVSPAKALAKDIDGIFAKKAASEPVVEKPPQKTLKSRQTVGTAPVGLVAEELADVHRKVKAARAVKSAVMPNVHGNDDFADIRGTKKRTIQLLKFG